MLFRKLAFVALSIFFILGVSVSGCDNTIDGFDEEGGIGGFSVFGYLNFNLEANYIRVKDLSAPILSDSTADLDATVSLTELESGITEQLQDSVVVYDDIATHNFRSTMDISPETAYRLTVENSQGEEQSFEAVTSADAEMSIMPEGGYSCDTFIQITFDPVRANELLQGTFIFDFRGADIEVDVEVQQEDDIARIAFLPGNIVSRGGGKPV